MSYCCNVVIRCKEESPLFRWKQNKAVTRDDLVGKLTQVLKQAGIDCSRFGTFIPDWGGNNGGSKGCEQFYHTMLHPDP